MEGGFVVSVCLLMLGTFLEQEASFLKIFPLWPSYNNIHETVAQASGKDTHWFRGE